MAQSGADDDCGARACRARFCDNRRNGRGRGCNHEEIGCLRQLAKRLYRTDAGNLGIVGIHKLKLARKNLRP